MATSQRKSTKRKSTARKVARTTTEPVAVYIHGIGQQLPEKELKHKWDLALFGREMKGRTRMAYWADIVHGATAKKSRPSKKTSRARHAPPAAAALLKEANVEPTAEALAFAEALAEWLAGSGGSRDSGREIRRKVLPLPRFLRRAVAERLLRWFVKDTAAYFFDAQKRRRIKERLIKQIPTGDEPFVLVAHSQGSIVAFEVLHELRQRRAPVELFVTIGSPLGIEEVQDLLESRKFPLQVPKRVHAWHNFADRLDPVALDASLELNFVPQQTVSIRDHMVVNERTKELLRLNPHSSVGYLANPAVRSVVHHAFGFDSTGRFVVARDVAEELIGDERRPVLIEALHPGYNALDEDRRKETPLREKRQDEKLRKLPGRIEEIAVRIRDHVGKHAVGAARVQTLRKYVAARLTPMEIAWLAGRHASMNVYAVWRSSKKSKLLYRSHAPIKVDAARASYGAEGRGITWAVLDTGARLDHPHLKGVVEEVLDCTTAGKIRRIREAKRSDPDGHGTHVAGIVAGEQFDRHGNGYRGIAPQAKLLVYKVLDDDGSGEDAWVIKAIDDIYRRNNEGTGLRVHGVNLSLGGPFDPTVYGCGYSPICQELRDIWRQGVLVCVAAGNEGQIRVLTDDGDFDLNTQLSIGDPANLEDCIAVGSVNADKPHLYGVSHFSSRGPTADGRAKPDLVAPGERITSCNADFRKTRRESWYRPDSGTSMACPHVSGMLAAFLSVRREFIGRPDEVKRILLDNCNDLGRDRYHQGQGLPNLMKMLLNT